MFETSGGIYVICVMNTINEAREICKQNNLRVIDVNDYRI